MFNYFHFARIRIFLCCLSFSSFFRSSFTAFFVCFQVYLHNTQKHTQAEKNTEYNLFDYYCCSCKS